MSSSLRPLRIRLIISAAPVREPAQHCVHPAMYLIYSLLFSLGVLITAPYYLWRLRGNIISGAGWKERFGQLPSNFAQSRLEAIPGPVWVHAVSVGETLAVAPLIAELEKRYPERKIFLSHVTPAGRKAGEGRLPNVAGRFYLPLDWKWSVSRAFKRVRPELLLVVETELWPNFLRAAHESGTRVALVNARLSERSFRGYRLAGPFMRRVLACVDWIGAQSAEDAERFRLLGAGPDRVNVTGNVKFDIKVPQPGEAVRLVTEAIGGGDRGPVLVAASTMPGEEALLLPAWEEIRRRNPRASLVLAPRHPARFDQVAQLLRSAGKTFVRRSSLAVPKGIAQTPTVADEILLLDTIGELAGVLSLADVVFVGGSLVKTGGHNLLEPAYWSKAILFGPHMENFRDTSALFLNAGAAVRVQSAAELAEAVLNLFENPSRRRRLGLAAKEVLERESGATDRILAKLHDWLIVKDEKRAAHPAVQGSATR
jgi:3-deoxy-D-manno-octulosonic-acid transferase